MAVDAKAGLARVTLVQRFDNTHAEPLSVTYKLPLPEDAAVSDFGFTVGSEVVRGVVQKKAEARETYERALADGQSGALLEQERTSLFSQELGNIPPGQGVEVRITLDQPLAWIADDSAQGSWEWRFPLAAAPRYLGGAELGADSPHFTSAGTAARASLSLHVRDPLQASPESPTHPLRHASGSGEIGFGSGNRMPLDRDVAIRWTVATRGFETSIDTRGEGSRVFGLLTIVPPARSANPRPLPRDLTLLLDTSGSMEGEPLAQEQRMALALIDALQEHDTLEVLEFSTQTRAFRNQPAAASAALKREASAWVMGLRASGGTEMVSGIEAAMRQLRPESQRQIVLITDGLIGFERQIVSAVLQKLPSGARLHAVGVGSAVNRSLVAPIARAGRGIEAVVGLGEDAERAAARVLARTSAPLAVDLEVQGSAIRQVVPSRLPDVFANAPVRVAVELDPRGGEIVVRGKTAEGAFLQRIPCPPVEPGEGNPAVAKLYARERVEDCEMHLSGGGAMHALDSEIEQLGVEFQIASRLTSWVAVTEQRTVDPRDPTRHVVQPHALAYGLRAEGLGLRPPAPRMAASAASYGAAAGGQTMGRSRSLQSQGAPPPPSPSPPMPPRAPSAMAPAAPPPPPPPAAMAPAKKSLPARFAEALRQPLGRGGRKGHGRSESHPSEAVASAAPADARVLLQEDQKTVLELHSPGFELDLAAVVCVLTLADGTVLHGSLLAEESTRPGFVAAGLRLRLAFRHASRAGQALSVASVSFTGAAAFAVKIRA